MPEAIRIVGLAEFRKQLRELDRSSVKALRLEFNEAAQAVVDWVLPRIPLGPTGRARRSVRTTSTQTAAKVTGGGARVPYYPWLDFGGRVGRKRSVHRAFQSDGRFLYPGYEAQRDEIQDRLADGIVRVARELGWDVKESGG